jgi:AcrR family transcriptional regulator
VLAGLKLQEVADEAGVNRGQIYQYFGSRQNLLRAAIAEFGWQRSEIFHGGRSLPFGERRARVFTEALGVVDLLKLQAMLALDGDESATVFPMLAQTRRDLERDEATGHLPAGADGLALHVLTAAAYLGYGVFREQFARELEISPDELDQRVTAAFPTLLAAVDPRPPG